MEPDRHLRPCSGSRFAPAHVHIGDKEDIQALTPSPEPRNHCAAGDIPVPEGAFDAVGDRIPVPQRASCPRPRRHAPSRVKSARPFEDAPTRRHPAPAGTLQYRRGHSSTTGDNRRRRGPNSCPPTRILSPPETTRTQPRGMSPATRGRPHQETPRTSGDIPAPRATIDAAGDRIPVPQRAPCPRPGRHAPSRAECPRRAPLRRCRTTWAVPGGPVAGTGRRPVGCGRAC